MDFWPFFPLLMPTFPSAVLAFFVLSSSQKGRSSVNPSQLMFAFNIVFKPSSQNKRFSSFFCLM